MIAKFIQLYLYSDMLDKLQNTLSLNIFSQILENFAAFPKGRPVGIIANYSKNIYIMLALERSFCKLH